MKIDKNKLILVNVDTQKDFMNPDGSLYVENSEKIKPFLKDLIKLSKDNNIKILNTADSHYIDSEEISMTPDFVNTFPPHCIIGTDGHSYIDETNPENPMYLNWTDDYSIEDIKDISLTREIVITKDKFDLFSGNIYSDQLTKFIKSDGYTTVVIFGVASNVCVNFAVNGFNERGFKIIVCEDAIMGLPGIDSPIDKWKENGIKIYTLKEIINNLK